MNILAVCQYLPDELVKKKQGEHGGRRKRRISQLMCDLDTQNPLVSGLMFVFSRYRLLMTIIQTRDSSVHEHVQAQSLKLKGVKLNSFIWKLVTELGRLGQRL